MADPLTTPDCNASTNAPFNAPPSLALEIVPLIEPTAPTVKLTPLLAIPATVTTTGPVVAPAGTAHVMLVLLQLVGDPLTPLNLTVLVPCVAPKLEPVIVTLVPTGPAPGERLLIDGGVTGSGTVTSES